MVSGAINEFKKNCRCDVAFVPSGTHNKGLVRGGSYELRNELKSRGLSKCSRREAGGFF